jgi:hypothetical protein
MPTKWRKGAPVVGHARRVKTGLRGGEVMGPKKYENVGKSQPLLIVIGPIVCPRPRVRLPTHGAQQLEASAQDGELGGVQLQRRLGRPAGGAGLVSWAGVVSWAGCQLSGAPRRLTWGVQRRRMSTDLRTCPGRSQLTNTPRAQLTDLRTVPSPEQGTSVSTRS